MVQTDQNRPQIPESLDELKRSEERLLMATEAGKVGIWEWNIAAGTLFWSDIVKDIYGIPRDQQPTMDAFQAAIHPDDKELTQERIDKALKAGSNHVYESYHRILTHGAVRWVQGFGRVIFDAQNGPCLMTGTVIDITERKAAEEKSIQLNALGRSLSRGMSTEDVAVIINRFAMDILGADALALYEMQADQLKLTYSDRYELETLAHLSLLQADTDLPYAHAGFLAKTIFIENQAEMSRLYPRLCPDGVQRASLCAIPLILNDTVKGVIGLSFNKPRPFQADVRRFILTFADQCAQALERVRLYEQERRARLEAEAASQAKSRFLANVSHEIRTPLGAILGFAELMQDPSMKVAERLDCIDTILRNGRILGKVIDDILDLSKIESEKLDIEEIDFDLIPFVSDILELLSLKAREKSLSLTLHTQGELPDRVRTDPTRLRQILVNLMSNALKFTPQGYVQVHIAAEMQESQSLLRFSVKDSGIGIDSEHAERIFEPFTQADTSTTRFFGGTGLGLAISRKLARALGGDIHLQQSRPAQGTCFVLTVRVGVAAAAPAETAEPIQPAAARELLGVKVLLVDDGPDNLVLISRFLQAAGAIVTTARNGSQGVEAALSQAFDLVIMDIQMPGMDGFGALKLMQERGYQKPVLALTAHAMRNDKLLSLKAGFKDHLVKPIDRSVLVAAVKKYALNGKRAPPYAAELGEILK